jgi:hypothetical protein
MKNQTKKIPRHFPYQHPKFGTDKKRKPESEWKNTVYYWWWAYLKRNTEYLACCSSGGHGDLAGLYADFGDVRGDDFKAWWSENERGATLFAEPIRDENIRLLNIGEEAWDSDDMLTLTVPLYLPNGFLIKRFREILDKRHTGKVGVQYAKQSKAKYQVKGQPNIPALEQALMVYDAIKATEAQGIKKPYWRIAMDLKLVEADKRIKADDPPSTVVAKKNVLTALVGRYKKRVDESISKAGKGNF